MSNLLNKEKRSLKIGFIGQGWIGKNYADDFENRGFKVVRYALEEPYAKNKEKIKKCDIVFIAVPTPTTPQGFIDEIVRKAVKNIGAGKIAVIKSTIIPGTTESIQEENPDIYILHSPEFLTEVTAAYDAANPNRNIIGVPEMNNEFRERAKLVLSILPKAPYNLICDSKEAELIKYGGNNWFYFKVIFINMLYDLAKYHSCEWSIIKEGLSADPRIGSTHLEPIHKGGRGAGGNCFIKDFATFARIYNETIGCRHAKNLLEHMQNKNIDLLLSSDKDWDLLKGVYGEEFLNEFKNQNKSLESPADESMEEAEEYLIGDLAQQI